MIWISTLGTAVPSCWWCVPSCGGGEDHPLAAVYRCCFGCASRWARVPINRVKRTTSWRRKTPIAPRVMVLCRCCLRCYVRTTRRSAIKTNASIVSINVDRLLHDSPDRQGSLASPIHNKNANADFVRLRADVSLQQGLYVEPKRAREVLKDYAGADPADLPNDPELFNLLQTGGLDKFLHLVFARSVSAQKVVDAVVDAVTGVSPDVLDRCVSMSWRAGAGIHGLPPARVRAVHACPSFRRVSCSRPSYLDVGHCLPFGVEGLSSPL